MQSKFWAAGSDDSEESGFSSSDSEGEQEQVQLGETTRRPVVASRWAAAETSSSDDEGGRVVKSLKDRRWTAMRETIRQMKNHMKIADFSELYKDYEGLVRCLQKSQQIVEHEGLPSFFVRIIVELEQFLEEKHRDKEAFKKLSKAKATAFNTLRAKVRKTNEQWQEKVDACKADPSQFASSESDDDDGFDSDDSSDLSDISESSESEDSEDEKPKRKAKDDDSEDSDEGSEWSDSEASSLSSGEETDKHKAAMAKWGLRSDGEKSRKQKEKKKTKRVSSKTKDDGVSTPRGEGAAAEFSIKDMECLFDTSDLNADVIRKRVQMVVEKRGRRGVDRLEQTRILKRLAELAALVGPQSELEVLGHLISAEFDTTSGVFACLSSAIWLDVYHQLECVLGHLEEGVRKARESGKTEQASLYVLVPTILASTDAVDAALAAPDAQAVSSGILTSFVERLDDELMKSLQFTDVHSEEYKERLGQSVDMMAVLCRAWVHLTDCQSKPQAATLALRINEHMHYKHDTIAASMWDLVRKRVPADVAEHLPDENTKPSDFVEKLTNIVFESESSRERTRALLHLAYSRALHDDFYKARDLLHTPNMQELALQTDTQTQILYNRDLVQLGLCAFRNGRINEAHACLSEVCPKHKELLAQGLSNLKNVECTPEQERAEKRRLLPYHMHISMELIEGAHNICAMLIEVPHMAHDPYEHRKRPISKHFRRMLETYDKQAFLGPPENARETVMAATKALQRGDWKECCRFIFSLGIWEKLMNATEIQEMLKKKVKQEAMRTYIFTYLTLYDSFSISQLCGMFELPESTVHSIVSKMMINEEIHASWDESSQFILISRVERTRLQQLATTLAENVNNAVEQNELTLNMKNPKFALSHDRRFQMRGDGQGDRFGWGGREREGDGGPGGPGGRRFGRGGRGGFGPGRGAGRGGRGRGRGGLRAGAGRGWMGDRGEGGNWGAGGGDRWSARQKY
ncbi:eukaryotic translation initiation factor 3 subunit C, related [Neospora caninum Liverpool]|uniref:Eukaryotic translation initiation factor 3 subunit C n=1 Tax=Neospora caninum (strain Liverpool) TaxID=572307 RepID=F0V7H3_NEOCL|nr:eukaryotic translation initiation factor 3 subunit C, related [Neospora caninum Liverpool]CBZ49664.1 eukaryotic translation initiation factor 3 subunit C, related [Neospora caninum Liverpool]CEL64248.1 TPA: Eukaryotic translation initiation factor 3 subunit C, related [Neospora caninum Liverpool]|eukprot:XP_003879699.1 eukaryotic translation initiation factor 3 subunit C, related [Neospora caninum Liverpool]